MYRCEKYRYMFNALVLVRATGKKTKKSKLAVLAMRKGQVTIITATFH